MRKKDEPADKAEVPIRLSCVWMNVVCGFQEDHVDVGCAFHVRLCVHDLCQVSDKKGEVVRRTYLTVSITKCLGLLIGNDWIDRIVVFRIGEVRLCGHVFLTIRGNMTRAARWFGRCCITWFALEGHDVIGIDCPGRRARSTGRSTGGRRDLGDEGVECCHGNLGLSHRRC